MGSEAEGLAESWQRQACRRLTHRMLVRSTRWRGNMWASKIRMEEHLSGCTFLFRVRAQLESGEVRCWSEWREEARVETMHDAKVKSMGGGFRFIDEQQ